MRHQFPLDDPALGSRVASLVREARQLLGWTQADLALRAGTSQSRLSRLELGGGGNLDVILATRLLAALGLRGTLTVEDISLADRRAQRDPVHAWIVALAARWLRAHGWLVGTELAIGGMPPRGWIDLLAYRAPDRAGLMAEMKGDLPDVGGLQRQVAFYERFARDAMLDLGWRPSRIATLVLALDSRAVHAAIRTSGPTLGISFPGHPHAFLDYLGTPNAPLPSRTLALVDPASRREDWLRRSPLCGRRSPPAYEGYVDAAGAISARQPRGGRPRTPPSASRSPPP